MYTAPFQMVELPPAPIFFTPKPKNVCPPSKCKKRHEIIPPPVECDGAKRPAHRHGNRVQARATSPPLRGRYAQSPARKTPEPPQSQQTTVRTQVYPDRATSPILGDPATAKARRPKPLHMQTAGKGCAESCEGDEDEAWQPSGFDVLSTCMLRVVSKLQGSLDERWKLLSNLLHQYAADDDGKKADVPLKGFFTRALLRAGQTPQGDFLSLRPSQPITCAAAVVLDQLLLLLRRCFPSLTTLIMDVRGVILRSIYVTPLRDGDMLPFDNTDDEFECQEQLGRKSGKTYFQATRELSARLGEDNPLLYEDTEHKRDRKTSTISRTISIWQTEYKKIVFKAWWQRLLHQKELAQRDKIEEDLIRRIDEVRQEVTDKEAAIARLEEQIIALQNTSDLERRLKLAAQAKQQLQKDFDNLSADWKKGEETIRCLEDTVAGCHQLVAQLQSTIQQGGAGVSPGENHTPKESKYQALVQHIIKESFEPEDVSGSIANALPLNSPPHKSKAFSLHDASTKKPPQKLPTISLPLKSNHILDVLNCVIEAAVKDFASEDHAEPDAHSGPTLEVGKAMFASSARESALFDENGGMTCLMEGFGKGAQLFLPYLVLFAVIDPSVVSMSAISAKTILKNDMDDEHKARTVLHYAEKLGLRLSLQAHQLINPNSAAQHVALSSFIFVKLAGDVDVDPSEDNCTVHLPAASGDTPQPFSLIISDEDDRQHEDVVDCKPNFEAGYAAVLADLQDKGEAIVASLANCLRTRSVAFGATKLSVNSCLEKMSGVQARTYNVSESTDMTHFCDVAAIVNAFEDGAEDSFRDTHEELWASHPVAGGAMLTPPRKRLHIEDETALNSVLLSNYISLRKLFKKDAVSDPPGYPISRLWDVLRMCHLTKAGSEDVDKKIAQINIAGLDGKGQAPPARSEEEYTKEDFVACLEAYSVPEETVLTPSQWVYVLLLVASDVFSAGVHKRLALHEKFYFLVEKKLFCYLDVCDITEFREVVYHTDVQDVLQEYSVKLRFVFDHYAEKKARMAFNQYVVFLADAGAVLGTDLRAARPGGEQKLSGTVCCDIYTAVREVVSTSGDAINFSAFTEILCCIAMYDNATRPYIPLARSLRKFLELRLLRSIARKLPNIDTLQQKPCMTSRLGCGDEVAVTVKEGQRSASRAPSTVDFSKTPRPAAPNKTLSPTTPAESPQKFLLGDARRVSWLSRGSRVSIRGSTHR